MLSGHVGCQAVFFVRSMCSVVFFTLQSKIDAALVKRYDNVVLGMFPLV